MAEQCGVIFVVSVAAHGDSPSSAPLLWLGETADIARGPAAASAVAGALTQEATLEKYACSPQEIFVDEWGVETIAPGSSEVLLRDETVSKTRLRYNETILH